MRKTVPDLLTRRRDETRPRDTSRRAAVPRRKSVPETRRPVPRAAGPDWRAPLALSALLAAALFLAVV